MRPFNETRLLWKNFVSSITSSPSSKKREHSRTPRTLEDEVLQPEHPADPGTGGGEGRPKYAIQSSKYDMSLLNDDDELGEIPLDLGGLEPTAENFAAVVAECNRLRNDKTRLQATLYALDSQMDEVVTNCEKVVAESNFRFKKAINSLMHMDTSLRSLKKESSKQARHLADVTSERNILRRQLDSALNELKNLKTCSLSWVRSGSTKVSRVQEGLTTPRRM